MAIRLYVQNTHFKVFYDEATDKEMEQSERLIKDTFKAEDHTLRNSPMVKRGLASPVRSFYISTKENPRESENLLLTGFLDELIELYKQNKIAYEVRDTRKYPTMDKDFLRALRNGEIRCGEYSPRDYQIEAVMAIAQSKGGILSLSMGAGKTFISYLLTKLFPKVKILMLFDGVELIHQTYKAFVNDYGMSKDEVGIIQGSIVDDEKRVLLLSVDSYEKAMEWFPYTKVIIIDEAHQVGSNTGDQMATRVMYSCQNAPIRVGLSATPDVIDNPYRQKALYGNLGPIVYKKTIKEQVDNQTLASMEVEVNTVSGFVVPIVGSYSDIYETKKITLSQRDEWEKKGYEILYKEEKYYARKFLAYGDDSQSYVFNERRNKIIAESVLAHKGRRVVLFTRTEHGKILQKLIPGSIMINGEDDITARNKAKQYLLENPDGIVLASSIWNQGIDIKWIEVLFLAGAGVSSTQTIQKFGRALRKSTETGKTSAKFVDFYDDFNPLVLKQSKKRLHIYQKVLGFKVNIK